MTKLSLLLTAGTVVAAAIVLLALRETSTLVATDAMPCGDLDGDGAVTVADVVIEVSYFAQTVPPAPPQVDMDGDGVVSVFGDILEVAAQLGTTTACQDKPPVGPKVTPPPTTTPQPEPELSLTVKSAGAICDDPFKPTKCTVPSGSTFTLSVEVNTAPTAGYVGFQTQVVYGTLKYKPTAAANNEIVWPESTTAIRSPSSPTGQEGIVAHAGLSSITLPMPVSSSVGNIVEIELNCAPDASFKVVLPAYALANPLGAAFMDSNLAQVLPKTVGQQLVPEINPDNPIPLADTLDINCTGPTPTPSPTATPTRTPVKPKNTNLDVVGPSNVPVGQTITFAGTANFLQDLDGDDRAGWSEASVLVSWPLTLGPEKNSFITAGPKSNCLKTLPIQPGLWEGTCLANPDPIVPSSAPEEVAPVSYLLILNCASAGTHTVTVTTTFRREDGSPVPPEKIASNADSEEITCTAPTPTETPTPTPTSTPTVTVPSPTKQPAPGDSDGDGCTDQAENGPNETLGGRRNYLNPWDFYDVNGDKVVNIFDDIIPVVEAFGAAPGPPYVEAYDRSAPPTEAEEPDPTKREPWDMGPPDGAISIFDDIFGVVAQFGHGCRAAP